MVDVFVYLAAAVVALWGIAHAIPTQRVVAGFEPTALDNHRPILQVWLAAAPNRHEGGSHGASRGALGDRRP